jgi:hypothetical protein
MQNGITALRDVSRMLRGAGAAQRTGSSDTERGALFDLAALADRLAGYVEDQSTDDWDDFWITGDDVATLAAHIDTVSASPRGLASVTLPALRALCETLRSLAPAHE